MILEDRFWLCVDSLHNDQPILGWHQFETAGRRALHGPVRCQLCFYHVQAGLVMGSVLDALLQTLAGDGDSQVSSVPEAHPTAGDMR